MTEKVLCELGSLCPVCNKKEVILGFKEKDATQWWGDYDVPIDKLVPVVSLERLEQLVNENHFRSVADLLLAAKKEVEKKEIGKNGKTN